MENWAVTQRLKNVKRNEPYFVYGEFIDSARVGYIDDNGKWRVVVCPEIDYWWHFERVKKRAVQNRRVLIEDNIGTFVSGLDVEKLTGNERVGIMLHVNSVLAKSKDGEEWQVIENRFLYRGDAAWRHDPILRRVTFKKNDIVFVRMPENPKKHTFDYIHMAIGLSGSDSKEFVHENYREIVKRAVKFLSETKKFTKFGVPVNVLKVEKAVLTKQGELLLTFGLKEIKMNEEKKGEAV